MPKGRFRDPALAEAILQCHAAGLTVPETAERVGRHQSAVYRFARAEGLKFNRHHVMPPKLTPEQEAKRRAAHAARMEERKNVRINGWTWEELLDAGFTATEAARVREQTVAAAFQAERRLGRKFKRHHKCPRHNPVAGLTEAERREYNRLRNTKQATQAEALEMMGRLDLLRNRQRGDPYEDLAWRMRQTVVPIEVDRSQGWSRQQNPSQQGGNR